MHNVETMVENGAQEIQAARLHNAAEQAATHAASLAMARWSSGYSLTPSSPLGSQGNWHAGAQDGFIAWLAAGGFAQAQYGDAALDSAPTGQAA